MRRLNSKDLKLFLDDKVRLFNQPNFIIDDPVSIPHAFKKKQDIEIAGLFAAILAWGQRPTIIRKCRELLAAMDNAPYEFVIHHKAKDLKRVADFKHRTFNATDTLFFIESLRSLYRESDTLEKFFAVQAGEKTIENGLIRFHHRFFDYPDYPRRTRKHLPTPERGSTCKRLNMYLRWMVRRDNCGVDFGLWRRISPAQLICPCDLHVDRVARRLKLIKRKQTDWLTAIELTNSLAKLDPEDPVKYDFALFGLGVTGEL